MQSSKSFSSRKGNPATRLKGATGRLMHAFSLPPSSSCSGLLLSQWNGKPVCQTRIVLSSRQLRVTTGRRKVLIMSEGTHDTNPEVARAGADQSFLESDEDVREVPVATRTSRPTSVWLFVIETAVQVTILALAIAGSIHTRRRVIMHLVGVLSFPQLALIANRVWSQMQTRARPQLASADSSMSVDEGKSPVRESRPSEGTANEEAQEVRGGELSLAQSNLISTSIRTAVAEEVDSLRYAIEQIEQTTEQRQQARNLAIAEAIASLDESLRSLRRSVDTRNQVEKSAPFALVSELEIVKSRLKQAERDKAELEVRLRATEDNFEEAKRQGERARREADEATSKELGLRTELAVASSRLLRLEDVTERLNREERRNDELQEQIINGTREQEGLRQSAEDAERRVVRVENIAKILREKVQELTGKSLQRYGQEGGDLFGGIKEKADDQFWPQRLRGKSDLRPDSVVYQELLREEKGSQAPKWPRDPLGMERDRQETTQQKKLPDDGGFGTGDPLSEQTTNDTASESKLLSPQGSKDTIFSFSRGEFDDSGSHNEKADVSTEEDVQTLEQSSRPLEETSDIFVAPEDSSSVENKNDAGQEDDASQPGSQGQKSSPVSSTTAEELKDESFGGAVESNLNLGASQIRQSKSDDSAGIKPSLHVQKSDNTGRDNGDHAHAENNKELEKVSVVETSNIPASSESTPRGNQFSQQQTEVPFDAEDQVTAKELVTVQESLESVKPDTSYGPDAEPQDSVEPNTAYVRDAEPPDSVGRDTAPMDVESQPDERTVPTEPLVSAKPTSDPDQLGTNSSISSGEQGSQHPAEVTTDEATTDEAKVVEVQKSVSYLESLSQHEQSRSPETIENQLRTARELVKKARTRGLAVKQADRLFERAAEKLERALERVDDRSEVEADLGGCLLAWAKTNIANPTSQERLSRALELLKSSLESQPDNETVLFNSGLCLCLVASTGTKQKAVEDYKMACDMYERLLQVNDNSRIACFNCGLSYVSLGRLSLGNESDESSRGYFERGTALFQRALELKPGDSKAISYLDDCRRRLKELDVL